MHQPDLRHRHAQGAAARGANEAVFKILKEIDSNGADPVEYVKAMLAQKKKIPGFRSPRVSHGRCPRHAPAANVPTTWAIPAAIRSG